MPFQTDLVVLTADKNGEMAMRGILERAASLGMRPVTADYYVHPKHDPGCLGTAAQLVRPFLATHARALVLFDREGCGREMRDRSDLERQVEGALAQNGWRDRCAAIVVDPELDAWMWSDSPHVDGVLGWSCQTPRLHAWLAQQGFLKEGQVKPPRPKEALQEALRHVYLPRSSSLYREMAQKVSLRRCIDPAFQKLRETLAAWFPAQDDSAG